MTQVDKRKISNVRVARNIRGEVFIYADVGDGANRFKATLGPATLVGGESKYSIEEFASVRDVLVSKAKKFNGVNWHSFKTTMFGAKFGGRAGQIGISERST